MERREWGGGGRCNGEGVREVGGERGEKAGDGGGSD